MPNEKVEELARASDSVMPSVPLTVEGSSVLHQMFRLRWQNWKTTRAAGKQEVLEEAIPALEEMEGEGERQSALYSLLGHKGDLLLLHFRRSFDELNDAQLRFAGLKLSRYLEPSTSYLSVVELGLYDSTLRLYKSLSERGIQPDTPEWEREIEEALAQHRKAMAPRLWPSIPQQRYLCFYPMDRRRGEVKNWYQAPMEDRQRMMREHGLVGRKYAGEVKQIITGSIGFDDWEWGVDLFADDPLVFKKLIYEMRFDEVSAVYALFGPFHVGMRFHARDLGALLEGRLPEYKG
jgi:hydrogen peroxide-dependent heme synthase